MVGLLWARSVWAAGTLEGAEHEEVFPVFRGCTVGDAASADGDSCSGDLMEGPSDKQ